MELIETPGIHHWEPAWELLLTFRWSFERLNISIHLILWCPPWPALLKNKFCSILTFLANLDKKKKIKNVNLARLCARLKPVFLSKKGPSKARLLTKMSPSEELGTLSLHSSNLAKWLLSWHGWVSFGRVTSLGNGPMDSVQVGKAVFVKEDYTTLGIEPRTYS